MLNLCITEQKKKIFTEPSITEKNEINEGYVEKGYLEIRRVTGSITRYAAHRKQRSAGCCFGSSCSQYSLYASKHLNTSISGTTQNMPEPIQINQVGHSSFHTITAVLSKCSKYVEFRGTSNGSSEREHSCSFFPCQPTTANTHSSSSERDIGRAPHKHPSDEGVSS